MQTPRAEQLHIEHRGYLDDQHQTDVKFLAKTAIEQRLYVSGWQLREYLVNAFEQKRNINIAVAYLDSKPDTGVDAKPVGVAFVDCTEGFEKGDCMVFVRKQHRRKQIGTRLLEQLMCYDVKPSKYFDGIKGSDKFFKKVLHKEAQQL